MNEALAFYEEELAIYEKLGDIRSRAVTLGDIARLKTNLGLVDEALSIHEERLVIFCDLGDLEGQARCRWLRAKLFLHMPSIGEEEFGAIRNDLIFAYQTLIDLGRVEGIAAVGFDLARFLAAGGLSDMAREIALRSLEFFVQLGWTQQAEDMREFLESLPSA